MRLQTNRVKSSNEVFVITIRVSGCAHFQQINILVYFGQSHQFIIKLIDEPNQVIKIQSINMSQQMKANVLIYTETNRSFIQQKVYDQFRYECLKDYELKDLDPNKMVDVLKKIYDFSQGNSYMQTFFQKAPDNIHKFIADSYKSTNETDDLIIDIGKLIDIIFACIEGGFDKQEPQKPKQVTVIENPQKKQPKQEKKKPQLEQKQQESEVLPEKVKKFYVPKPKTPQKKNFIQKYEMPQKKMPARYLMHMAKQVKKEAEVPAQPEVKPLDLSYIERNRILLEKRLQDLYQHYCAQQQNVGKNTTFDRIKQQCNQMTIGKFLLFCKVSKLFQHKEMSKQILSAKFKKISEGKKEIQFERFKQLIALTDEQYILIRKRNQGDEAVIPTYQARLMLQGNDYKKLKKDVDLPFYTREKQGRELQKYTKTIDTEYTKRQQLTSHSGKFGKDLKKQIQRKLVSQSLSSKVKDGTNSSRSSTQKSKIIRLDNIRYQNMAGMEWVLEQDQSDKTFMKEYRLRDIVGDLKKRVNDLQKMEKNKVF